MTYLSEKEFKERTEAKHPDVVEGHPNYDFGAVNE
jgi:hypothetical protein